MKKIVFYSVEESSASDCHVSFCENLGLVRKQIYSVLDGLLEKSEHLQISILFSSDKKPIAFDVHFHDVSVLEDSDL